jgi:hypothetical protein
VNWVGWIFDTRRQRWDRVCQADSVPECSKRLNEILDARGVRDRYATLTGGREPSFRPRGRGVGAAEGDEAASGPGEDLDDL